MKNVGSTAMSCMASMILDRAEEPSLASAVYLSSRVIHVCMIGSIGQDNASSYQTNL